MDHRKTTRREFGKITALAGIGFWSVTATTARSSDSANSKLNIAVVGTARRGASNLKAVSETENIVALCDIDDQLLGLASEKFPRAKTYNDFRLMLEQKNIDAVVVSTPDHTHAVAAIAAMKSDKHVYCEKPLAHSIHEARVMRQIAEEQKVVTQMGNQLHATNQLRQVVEFVRAGALGNVREVVTWSNKVFSGGDRPKEKPSVPSHIHWDLWLGPAPRRPYHTAYIPRNWRGWWDFGEGNFGDMACHIIDAPFWALDLNYPTTVSAEGPPVHPESAPPALVVRYEFPARGKLPPVRFTWYDGAKAPPSHLIDGVKLPNQGALFFGDNGTLLFTHGGGAQLLVDSKVVDFEYPEPSLPRVKSHHQEWITACKTGSQAISNFAYGSVLTEVALAGIVAYRVGKELQWDGPNAKATNCPDADRYIRPELQNGWKL